MNELRVVAIGPPPTFRQQVVRALETETEPVEWVPSVTAAEAVVGSRDSLAEVLVLSPDVKDMDAFGLAEFVGRVSPATAILLVRDRPLNGLLPAAMRAGIRDVVDLSQGGEELRDALTRALAWSRNLRSVGGEWKPQAPESRGQIISVFSSKGGTGKTFLASNLAAAIARKSGSDTALVDLDLDLGDVFANFGKEATRPVQDILALGEQYDKEVILSMGTQLGEHLHGFAAVRDPSPPPVAGEAVGKILRNLRGVFDYTVIDATADYSDSALAAFDLSDRIYLITGLDVVGVRHLSVALETLMALGYPRELFSLVMNRADSKVGLSSQDVERVTRLHVDYSIPSSRLVPASLNKGRPVVIEEPKSEVAKAVEAIAARIVAPAPAQTAKRGRHAKR